jgi:hypothetical protein
MILTRLCLIKMVILSSLLICKKNTILIEGLLSLINDIMFIYFLFAFSYLIFISFGQTIENTEVFSIQY